MTELSVSIVIYHADLDELTLMLSTLAAAGARAREAGALERMAVWIVDNGGNDAAALDAILARALGPSAPWLTVDTLRGHGNVGFGRGHNLAIERSAAAYHLVLNPDVVLDRDALLAGLGFLESHPAVGLVTPRAEDEAGDRQYLCKRYPTVAVLGLRGFAPAWLRRTFRRPLEHYEMRDLPDDAPSTPIPIASGCFMLCRREALTAIGGFSPEYFLYFEDFDLSLRLGRTSDIAHVPAVRIRHAGGEAAGKGWAHRRMFIRSGFTFFRRHGWRLW